jgi:NAD(P)-dependent dehydrogenase (short-subunit alcohol dehydrogenase family)
MRHKKVWFITGAGRGMGVDFAKAALAAGYAVVASGRDTERVSKALGQSNDLLAVRLDVTITIASQEPPPRRFIAGADAIATAEQVVADLKTQIDANRDLSTSLALDEEPATRAM